MIDRRPTILFADDDSKVTAVATNLVRATYTVLGPATNGKQALESILAYNPDYAVLDISMPGMNGFTVAKKLREARNNTLLIFLTITDEQDYIEKARVIGNGYVLKRRLSLDLTQALTAAGQGQFFCSVQPSKQPL